MRSGALTRQTKETQIEVALNLDGTGVADIDTGIGFFDHMLTALAVHSGMDLRVHCQGDLQVDGHHTVEDTGIALGEALRQALGVQAGIARYGNFVIPMDEALAAAVIDVSGRPYLVFEGTFAPQMVGAFDPALTEEFFRALAFHSGMTLHIHLLYGHNDHHKIEAIFKAVAHSLRAAVAVTGTTAMLSTKGAVDQQERDISD